MIAIASSHIKSKRNAPWNAFAPNLYTIPSERQYLQISKLIFQILVPQERGPYSVFWLRRQENCRIFIGFAATILESYLRTRNYAQWASLFHGIYSSMMTSFLIYSCAWPAKTIWTAICSIPSNMDGVLIVSPSQTWTIWRPQLWLSMGSEWRPMADTTRGFSRGFSIQGSIAVFFGFCQKYKFLLFA